MQRRIWKEVRAARRTGARERGKERAATLTDRRVRRPGREALGAPWRGRNRLPEQVSATDCLEATCGAAPSPASRSCALMYTACMLVRHASACAPHSFNLSIAEAC